ncbi:MAG: 1-phosphofructokinase [Anaerolineae bacterium]
MDMDGEHERKIVTVTLSPSLERTVVTHYLAVGYHNRSVEATRLDPAGEGVNISRAVHRLKGRTLAVVLLGDDAIGRAYQALIEREGFEVVYARVRGQTPGRTIILDTGHNNETHLIEEGAVISRGDLLAIDSALQEHVRGGDYVVCAGPLPEGAPLDTYAQLVYTAHKLGASTMVEAGGEPLREALAAAPDLVVLSQIEAEAFFNFPVRSQQEVVHCAHRLCEMGAGRALILMREASTAVLAAKGGGWLVDLAAEAAGTTSGVWDALIAGYLTARMAGKPVQEALELGAAAAMFTAEQVGSEFGTPAQVKPYVRRVDVGPIPPDPDEGR